MSFNIVHRSRGVRHRVGAMFPSRKNNANVDKDKQSIGKRTKQTDEEHEIVIDFVTLGMFIIDEIEYPPPQDPAKDIAGGAGTYSAVGARLFSPPPSSLSVGWIVDQGSDFPPSLTTLIHKWQTSAIIRCDDTRLTTRGWNGYNKGDETRAFKYLTPKKRLTAEDLTPDLLRSKCFHLICSPTRCQELVAEIKKKRKAVMDPDSSSYTRPIFIWEPVPDLCTPYQLINLTNTLPLIDVLSPNHSELAGFMGDDGLDPVTRRISQSSVERACEQLLGSMPLSTFTIVVRAGEKGCYICKPGGRKKRTGKGGDSKRRKKAVATTGLHGLQPDTDMEALFAGLVQEDGAVAEEEIEFDDAFEEWIPASHDGPAKVVDPTGAGNAFLGGLGVALARGESIRDAAIWGNVAASFTVEQVGVPYLDEHEEGEETWNGFEVQRRLREYKQRLNWNRQSGITR